MNPQNPTGSNDSQQLAGFELEKFDDWFNEPITVLEHPTTETPQESEGSVCTMEEGCLNCGS
jgi:hypothetical protein